MNILGFCLSIPKIGFFLKRMETVLIEHAMKTHGNHAMYSQTLPKVLEYIEEFKKSQSQSIKVEKNLNFSSNTNNKYIYSFTSPFKPLSVFAPTYESEKVLHNCKVHFYPSKEKLKDNSKRKALIYLHGWGKGTFKVEELWHFQILDHAYKADIYALELPYHFSRNPGGFSGQGFLDGDPVRTIEAFRQSMVECILVYKNLKALYEEVGIVGISLGGHIAAYVSLYLGEDAFILSALAGTPLSNNLKHLNISPNLRDALRVNNKKFSKALEVLDYTNIPLERRNKKLFLFGGRFDSVIDQQTVQNLGNYLQCTTTIVPTGHFTFALALPIITGKLNWV